MLSVTNTLLYCNSLTPFHPRTLILSLQLSLPPPSPSDTHYSLSPYPLLTLSLSHFFLQKVRRDRRKKGIAQQLMQAAEQYVRDEIAPVTGLTPAIYLLVDSENIPAQKLYKKLGYKLQVGR